MLHEVSYSVMGRRRVGKGFESFRPVSPDIRRLKNYTKMKMTFKRRTYLTKQLTI
jgi:hypothetical protein